jgi:predicted ATP-binding protein involved in virulence
MRIDEIFLRQVGPFEEARIPLPAGKKPNLADIYLLTGPNGSGKSTVLYALAGLIGFGLNPLGQNMASRRFRSAESVSAIAFNGKSRAEAWRYVDNKERHKLQNPFGGELMREFESDFAAYFYSGEWDEIRSFCGKAHQFRIHAPAEARSRFGWAAFAYAGMRSVTDGRVEAIKELTDSPFENCLSFVHTSDTNRLAQWIANQDFRRLKAKEAGKLERAEELRRSIRDIERVVSGIIEEEDFAFVTGDADNHVRVRRNGNVVDLGLLPDGLKSIVSWVADLLMRLDRIPWIDDTPPMQRPFLLLLDEVDIHLHPSWQRKVLPIVQRMFPRAQIIASTHSPFVVASADDAHIITFDVKNGVSRVESIEPSQVGVSYSTVLRSIFGIETEFDVETEREFSRFHDAKTKLLSGTGSNLTEVQELGKRLAQRSEEVRELVGVELRQLDRQLANSNR